VTQTTGHASPTSTEPEPSGESAASGVKSTEVAGKGLRADAARNRQKLIDVATAAFTERGADVPLDEIARTAGVGIGTLYRHFPTREDLVLAIYGSQIKGLEDRSFELPTQFPPGEALRQWMHGFVDYYAVKQGMVHLLRSMTDGRQETFESARATLLESAERVLQPAIDAGAVRADVSGAELVRALGGICLAGTSPGGLATSLALVDLVFDGLRFGAAQPTPSA
jgi:AcrR family transcriptional regulator